VQVAAGVVLALRQAVVLPRFRAVAGVRVASDGSRAADAARSLPVRVTTALTRVSIISTLPKLGPALATGAPIEAPLKGQHCCPFGRNMADFRNVHKGGDAKLK